MLERLRAPTGWRGTLAALAMLALTLKLLMPPGFMPGTSLSSPIMLCPDQGAMPMAPGQGAIPMAMGAGEHGDHTPMHHGAPDHQCSFAGLGVAAVAVPLETPAPVPAIATADPVAASAVILAPGRGLAAPPPPSHAPPVLRA